MFIHFIISGVTDLISDLFIKAEHKETKTLAAAKICEIEHEEDLDDFAVEIDILSECKHRNIVELLEAYVFDGKLWVSTRSQV